MFICCIFWVQSQESSSLVFNWHSSVTSIGETHRSLEHHGKLFIQECRALFTDSLQWLIHSSYESLTLGWSSLSCGSHTGSSAQLLMRSHWAYVLMRTAFITFPELSESIEFIREHFFLSIPIRPKKKIVLTFIYQNIFNGQKNYNWK